MKSPSIKLIKMNVWLVMDNYIILTDTTIGNLQAKVNSRLDHYLPVGGVSSFVAKQRDYSDSYELVTTTNSGYNSGNAHFQQAMLMIGTSCQN